MKMCIPFLCLHLFNGAKHIVTLLPRDCTIVAVLQGSKLLPRSFPKLKENTTWGRGPKWCIKLLTCSLLTTMQHTGTLHTLVCSHFIGAELSTTSQINTWLIQDAQLPTWCWGTWNEAWHLRAWNNLIMPHKSPCSVHFCEHCWLMPWLMMLTYGMSVEKEDFCFYGVLSLQKN